MGATRGSFWVVTATYFKKYLNSLNIKPLNKWSIFNQKVDDKGILDPIDEWEGYFGAHRWMEGIFV